MALKKYSRCAERESPAKETETGCMFAWTTSEPEPFLHLIDSPIPTRTPGKENNVLAIALTLLTIVPTSQDSEVQAALQRVFPKTG